MKMNMAGNGSSMDAATEMLYVIDRFQRSKGRSQLPPHNLAIDFPQKSALGKRALGLTARDGAETIGIMCEADEVLDTVCDMRSRTPGKLRDVGIVLLNYVMHDLPPCERERFIEVMRSQCPDAVFIVADYTMREVPAEEARRMFTAALENQRMSGLTDDEFLQIHRQTTYADLVAMLYGFPSVRGHRLPAARALVAGGQTRVWTPDLAADWNEELAPDRPFIAKNAPVNVFTGESMTIST